jgi:hypothetical protein
MLSCRGQRRARGPPIAVITRANQQLTGCARPHQRHERHILAGLGLAPVVQSGRQAQTDPMQGAQRRPFEAVLESFRPLLRPECARHLSKRTLHRHCAKSTVKLIRVRRESPGSGVSPAGPWHAMRHLCRNMLKVPGGLLSRMGTHAGAGFARNDRAPRRTVNNWRGSIVRETLATTYLDTSAEGASHWGATSSRHSGVQGHPPPPQPGGPHPTLLQPPS